MDQQKQTIEKRGTYVRIQEMELEKEELYFDLPLKFVEDRKCGYYENAAG